MNKGKIIKDFIILIFAVFSITCFLSPFYMMFLLTHLQEEIVDKTFIISVGVIHLIIYLLYFIKVKRDIKNENEKL